MKIVFFGNSTFNDLIIPYLKDFEIELIVDKNTPLEKVKEAKAEVAILATFGKILPKWVLDSFKYGILNIHPSLLPKYRGPSPVQTAILNGDKKTGVTVIKLDMQIDHGPILNQKTIEILKYDTAQTLYEKLFPMGAKLIVESLEKYINGNVKLTPQSHSKATYTKILKRDDGYIDISSIKIEELERKIRAYYPWPGTWTKWQMASVRQAQDKNDKWQILKFLPDKKLQVEGKKPIRYKDFINGYPNIDKRLLILLK